MVLAIRMTGLGSVSSVLSWETVSSLMLDFYRPKYIDTDWDKWRRGLSCRMYFFLLQKVTLQALAAWVFLFVYSNKRILTASHYKKGGDADQTGADKFSGEKSHVQNFLKYHWGEGNLPSCALSSGDLCRRGFCHRS